MRSSRNAVMPFPGRLPTGISTTPNAMVGLRKRTSSGGGGQAPKRQRTHNSTRITIDVPTILNQTMPPPPKVEDIRQFGQQNRQNSAKPILRIKIPSDSLSRQKSADRPETLVTPECLGSSGLDTGPGFYRRNLLSPPGVGSLKRETSDGSIVLTPTMEVTGNGFQPAFMPRTPMQTMTTQPASITREDLPGIQNIPGPPLPGLQDLPSLPKQEGMKPQ